MLDLRTIRRAFGVFTRFVLDKAKENGFILLPADKVAEIERAKREGSLTPEQWKRWYKANRKYQRQMTAARQQTGIFVHPNESSLRREDVR